MTWKPNLAPTNNRYRYGDKTSTGHVDDKANKLHAIASLRVLLDATKEQTVANGRDPNEEVNDDDSFPQNLRRLTVFYSQAERNNALNGNV